MLTNTAEIKSTPLLPKTAELEQFFPSKENFEKNEDAKETVITSDYFFNSSDVQIDSSQFFGGTITGLEITLNPTRLGIFFPSAEETKLAQDGFIGIISDEEAKEMKEEVGLFKKKFDDDLTTRNKILFGE
ncbi:MAG: hypothetical protein WC514_02105 [Candidatus Paceibacterota bacterium]